MAYKREAEDIRLNSGSLRNRLFTRDAQVQVQMFKVLLTKQTPESKPVIDYIVAQIEACLANEALVLRVNSSPIVT